MPPPEETNVEDIDIRQFFYRSNPSSPLPRNRLNRLTSRHVNLFHRMSVKEEEPGEPKPEPSSSLPPTLRAKVTSYQRL